MVKKIKIFNMTLDEEPEGIERFINEWLANNANIEILKITANIDGSIEGYPGELILIILYEE